MEKILVIKIRALGDVLRTTCILPGLHEKFPNSNVEWLTSAEAVPFLSNNLLITKVMTKEYFTNLKLSEKKYGLVINLEDDEWACALAVSVNATTLIGAYSLNGVQCYTDDSNRWFDMSLISRYGKEKADQLKRENCATYPELLFEMLNIPAGKPSLLIPEREKTFARDFARKRLPDGHPVIGLNTGAGPRWRFKALSPEATAKIADQLIDSLNATVLLFGGPNEKLRNQTIEKLSNENITNTGTNNSSLEFSALIALCDVLITSDSLALHIASCFGIPVVVFFGPTSSTEIQLFGPGEKIIPNVPCICCYKEDCNIESTCMDNISTRKIYTVTKRLLSSS